MTNTFESGNTFSVQIDLTRWEQGTVVQVDYGRRMAPPCTPTSLQPPDDTV